MSKELSTRVTDFLIYTTPQGDAKVEVFLHEETIWLTQKKMAELFGVQRPAITKHLKNVFKSGELEEKEVSSILERTTKHGAIEGKTQINQLKFYNLDAIISVGYRVNSQQATHFRIWATKILKEHIIKGFSMDDDRLKNGQYFEKDYFKELLERVRSIRASERRIYQQITDIFAECSIDYDPRSDITREFYASIQNKFHYAIVGQTAAEIIYDNVSAKKKNMGLSTWKNAPDGRILKSDAIIAKNYLKVDEIKKLERTISSFFDYIERIIENRTVMKMDNLAQSVNRFLDFNEFKILEGKGGVSFEDATKKALKEYNRFNKHQKINSDFDEFSRKVLGNNQKPL